jgi:two-component system sensor histidine kinase MtrB
MDVSHELRSPMGRIKMAAEMLPVESLPNGAGTELKIQIQNDVREMEDLVTELLEVYRLRDSPQKIHTEEIELGSLIREVATPYVQPLPGVRYQLLLGSAAIRADARQLKKAIRNVIENAVKFSRDQDRPVEIRLAREEGFYLIEIEDHGIGMTPEQCAHVFEPFYRGDSSRVRETGGFGLGLPLAQAIVQAHGGSIECSSLLGSGCTFKIRLPV